MRAGIVFAAIAAAAVIIIAAVIMISLSKDEKIETLNGPQSDRDGSDT